MLRYAADGNEDDIGRVTARHTLPLSHAATAAALWWRYAARSFRHERYYQRRCRALHVAARHFFLAIIARD